MSYGKKIKNSRHHSRNESDAETKDIMKRNSID